MVKKFDKEVWTTVPHLYIDTNIFAEVIEGQHRPSIQLLELVKEKDWRCSTSIFTLMELADVRQDNKYVYNKLSLGTHIKKAFRSLDQRDLPLTDLHQIQEKIDSMFADTYPFVEIYSLEDIGWDKALDLKAKTNISAPDAIHLATAIEAGCDILVSLDNFLIKQATPFIKACLPEHVKTTLPQLGFHL